MVPVTDSYRLTTKSYRKPAVTIYGWNDFEIHFSIEEVRKDD